MIFHTKRRFQGRVSQKVKLFSFWYTLHSNRGPVPGPRPAPREGINKPVHKMVVQGGEAPLVCGLGGEAPQRTLN